MAVQPLGVLAHVDTPAGRIGRESFEQVVNGDLGRRDVIEARLFPALHAAGYVAVDVGEPDDL